MTAWQVASIPFWIVAIMMGVQSMMALVASGTYANHDADYRAKHTIITFLICGVMSVFAALLWSIKA